MKKILQFFRLKYSETQTIRSLFFGWKSELFVFNFSIELDFGNRDRRSGLLTFYALTDGERVHQATTYILIITQFGLTHFSFIGAATDLRLDHQRHKIFDVKIVEFNVILWLPVNFDGLLRQFY